MWKIAFMCMVAVAAVNAMSPVTVITPTFEKFNFTNSPGAARNCIFWSVHFIHEFPDGSPGAEIINSPSEQKMYITYPHPGADALSFVDATDTYLYLPENNICFKRAGFGYANESNYFSNFAHLSTVINMVTGKTTEEYMGTGDFSASCGRPTGATLMVEDGIIVGVRTAAEQPGGFLVAEISHCEEVSRTNLTIPPLPSACNNALNLCTTFYGQLFNSGVCTPGVCNTELAGPLGEHEH